MKPLDTSNAVFTGEMWPIVARYVVVVAYRGEDGEIVVDSVFPFENTDMAWDRSKELFEGGYEQPFVTTTILEFADMTRPGHISDLDLPAHIE